MRLRLVLAAALAGEVLAIIAIWRVTANRRAEPGS